MFNSLGHTTASCLQATFLTCNSKWAEVPGFMENFMGGMESVKAFAFGASTDAMKEGLAGWDAAPGFDVKLVTPTSSRPGCAVRGHEELRLANNSGTD